jgi:hypothetical protein
MLICAAADELQDVGSVLQWLGEDGTIGFNSVWDFLFK